jgi:hypothetical protein
MLLVNNADDTPRLANRFGGIALSGGDTDSKLMLEAEAENCERTGRCGEGIVGLAVDVVATGLLRSSPALFIRRTSRSALSATAASGETEPPSLESAAYDLVTFRFLSK